MIPRKSAADALPHQHRNLRPFDDACAWIRQKGNTARRRVVLHGFMASLTSIQVACAPEITALLETIPFCECKKDNRLSLTRAFPDRHLQERLLFGMQSHGPIAFTGCSLRMRFCGMDAASLFLPSRQHEGIEALESCASECLTTYNLPCTKPQLQRSCAAQQQQHGRFPHAKMAKQRRPSRQDAAFVIPSKSAALTLPHQHRNLRPFDDACAWIRQNRNTARRRVVLHGFMASLTSIQVVCAPEITALLETIPFCECKKGKRLSRTRAFPDRHLQECLLFGTQSQDPVAFTNCSLRMRFCGMDAASLFLPSRTAT